MYFDIEDATRDRNRIPLYAFFFNRYEGNDNVATHKIESQKRL